MALCLCGEGNGVAFTKKDVSLYHEEDDNSGAESGGKAIKPHSPPKKTKTAGQFLFSPFPAAPSCFGERDQFCTLAIIFFPPFLVGIQEVVMPPLLFTWETKCYRSSAASFVS